MVGCSWTCDTHRFFFGINISYAVHPTINIIRIIELWHNQTQMNKMLNWIVPVCTGVYYSFLYLLFYFQIISSINRRKGNNIYIRNSLIPFGRISFHNYLGLFRSLVGLTTWSNVEESGINGRYYWKDSSLDNRYCNWYCRNWFSWYFLLWFIFRIGIIPVVIGWISFSKWKKHKNSTGIHSFFDEFEGVPLSSP